MVISGTDLPLSTFISHSPALRTGNSTATAPFTGNKASRPMAEQDTRSSRLMRRLPLNSSNGIVFARREHTPGVAKTCPAGNRRRSVKRAQRPLSGAIGTQRQAKET
jgi:hypothetical protein